MIGIPPPSPAAKEGGLLGLLLLDAILLGAFGLAFTPLYIGSVPAPLGALLVILILPWLVLRAAEVDPRSGVAASPLWAWLLTVLLLGLWGPGGDAMLPMASNTVWMSLLLIGGGLVAGVLALRWANRGAGTGGVALTRPGPKPVGRSQDAGTR
jgi:hypothetical protein